MKILIFFIMILFAFYGNLQSQVDILIKDGESYRAIILEQTEQKIQIKKIKDNSILTIDKLFIDEIQPLYTLITTFNNESFEGTIEGIDSSKIVLISKEGNKSVIERKQILHTEIVDYYSIQSYPMLGLTSGYPGFLQIIGGYQFRFIGLRLDCGLPVYDKDIWGIKSNFLVNLFKRKNYESNLDLSFGYIHNPPAKEISFYYFKHEWRFIGISADINIYGFFIELGITNNINDFGEYSPHIQLGCVYRFIN